MNKLVVILLLIILSVLLNTSFIQHNSSTHNSVKQHNSKLKNIMKYDSNVHPLNPIEKSSNYKKKRDNYLLLDPEISSQSLKIANSKYLLF